MKISQLDSTRVDISDILDIAAVCSDKTIKKVTLSDILNEFSLFIHSDEKVAKNKVKLFLKSIQK